MAVLHVLIDTCDAMGANIINQICEFLKPRIEQLTGECVNMCILSNLNDTRLAWAKITMQNIPHSLAERIEEASIFAECDPYRASTNNKGILNGMDPILVATGNDWRAVEAGVHAYACQDGQYRSLSKWRYEQQVLTGYLEAPIMVGTVGGMTRLHPTAQHCLAMMNIKHSDDLARIVVAVGLVQNLGAIRALTHEGIIQGHMKLHIDNLILSAGANDSEALQLKQRLNNILESTHRVSLTHALEILKEIREKPHWNTSL
jgi:hydroxymethylglutaryl-CoA reductase